MALWGNKNNIDNVGLITGFGYDTKIVFGAGTSFGESGSAQVGDVISVGVRSDAGTYYGNVVIVSIASTQECAIAHTEALVAETIADLSAVTSSAGTSISSLRLKTLLNLLTLTILTLGSAFSSCPLLFRSPKNNDIFFLMALSHAIIISASISRTLNNTLHPL